MALEALASAGLPAAFLVYDTLTASATPFPHDVDRSSSSSFLLRNAVSTLGIASSPAGESFISGAKRGPRPRAAAEGQGIRRKRRQRTCKNKEEAETQRMTHIAIERNRRRQMNEHLAVMRSLMPESYVHRGDQASIVGGAIDFVKELEQLLQSLEAQKRTMQQQAGKCKRIPRNSSSSNNIDGVDFPPFAQFFSFPQYSWCHTPQVDYSPTSEDLPPPALADIEVTLIETHANVRILSPKRPGQLFKIVAGLHSLRLAILHLNVTSLESTVLYSLSLKVEEGCNLTAVDDIAAAIHHMLSLIEAEVTAIVHQGRQINSQDHSLSFQNLYTNGFLC